mmetsp:Transcript_123257/g.383600  ORF Transcript_123257/g.383600 Transcript_123257/m.383600 type:complete len:262 (-) Transcript_123257:101-886(-)
MADDGYNNVPKAVLKPRHPGENIKVAQVVLKRRDMNLKAAAERAAKISQVRKNKKNWERGNEIVRAETLVINQRQKRLDLKRFRKISKQPKRTNQSLPPMIMASRNGRMGGCAESKKVMRSLGLRKRHAWVFLACNKELIKDLWKCKPYVFWGRPTFKSVFNMIHKKAMFKKPDEPDERVLLSDNNMIEEHLGDLGIICTEDLAHSLHKCDKNFPRVVERLWPVYLGDVQQSKGMVRETTFREGPQSNKEMNDLITTLMGV